MTQGRHDGGNIETVYFNVKMRDGSDPLVERRRNGELIVDLDAGRGATWSSPEEALAWLDKARRKVREYLAGGAALA